MRVVRRIDYRLPKLSSPRPLLDRVIGALQRNDIVVPPPHIHFEQSPHIGTSAIERATRRFPELSPLVGTYRDGNGTERAVISSVGSPSTLSWPTALALADGVPRRFPFNQAAFFVAPIHWSSQAAPPTLPTGPHVGAVVEALYSTPSITVNSDWWISKRQYSMRAVVSTPTHLEGPTLPPPPPNVSAALAELGSVRQEELVPTLEPAEQEQIDRADPLASKIMAGYDASTDEIASTLPFPHLLPHPLNTFSLTDYEACGTLKTSLIQAYRVLGYHYESRDSGQGVFILRKRTALHHSLEVHVDVGSYSKHASFLLCLDGPGWRARALVPVNCHAAHSLGYPIVNAGIWRRIVENSVVAVRYLESSFVSEIEALYPAAPAWYRYGL